MTPSLLHCAQFDEWATGKPLPAGFPRVQVACALPRGFGGPGQFPGSELPALQQRLHDTMLALLQGQPATTVSTPEQLLDLLLPALADTGLQRVSWQAGARRGAHWLADGSATLVHWRRYRFQAAHRLPHVPRGHKCGRMHGHGFEAVVAARGCDAETLDEAWSPLHMQLNYACLNTLDGLENPTSEHLARWLWQRLQPALPGLQGVSVFETASCGAHASDDGLKLRIWKDFTLDSATQLSQAPPSHPRAALHGHTYTLRLHLQAALDAHLGWAVDFGDVKSAFKPVFDALDHHRVAHAHSPSADTDKTHPGDVATLARWVAEQSRPLLPALTRVDLFETDGNGVVLGADASQAPLLPSAGA
jgi:6-pyruvoyltetrahydropterin/6-carboxytetrahydropterin synthase